ncbi:MAG: sensor histidine kinase [Marmoricola sp.]
MGVVHSDSPRVQGALLAVALAAFAQVDLHFNLDNSTHYGSNFSAAVIVATATLALAWCRTWPLTTLCVVAGTLAIPEIFSLHTVTLWGHFVPLVVAVYALARWCPSRVGRMVGVVVALAVLAILLLRVPSVHTAGNVPFSLAPITLAFVTGTALRYRQQRHSDLAAHASQLESERAAEIAAAVRDERARIARELHDIVAHSVSVMVVQAGASEDLLDRAPERAREPLRAVQETGRQAVAELRRMLGLLRIPEPGADSVGLTPQPGTDQLPDLVAEMRALGLPVELTTEGERRPLAPGVDLTVYRVAQEALTNTLKHAGPGARSCIVIRYLATKVEVEISDDGTALARRRKGHGLIGMAERASLYGGKLVAGSDPAGGFRVHLTLPAEPSGSAPAGPS